MNNEALGFVYATLILAAMVVLCPPLYYLFDQFATMIAEPDTENPAGINLYKKADFATLERAVRNAALEEAAQLAEVYQKDAQDPWEWPGGIAKDIRALIEEPK